MRLILICVLCFCISCHSNKNHGTVEQNVIQKGSKYYAPFFGVIYVHDDFIGIYRGSLPETRCYKDKKSGNYVCDGPSLTLGKDPVSFSLSPLNSNQILLEYAKSSEYEFPLSQGRIFNMVPDSIPLNFEFISIITYRDGHFEEVRVSLDEILALEDETKVFTLREQLWLLFCSGVVDNSIEIERHESIHVRLLGDNMYRERYLRKVVVPKYISDIVFLDKGILAKRGIQ